MSATQSKTTQRYAVIGASVEHSLSPPIHQAFATSMGKDDLRYERLMADEANAVSRMRDFFNTGGRGLSVTMPLKKVAYELADECHPRAVAVGAANTLTLRDDGSVLADNTDGLGLFDALRFLLGWSWVGKRVLLIGAGGAARAALPPLLAGFPEVLVVVNRTEERAKRLVDRVQYRAPSAPIDWAPIGHEAEQPYDVLIHATGAGVSGELPAIANHGIDEHTKVYDISYGERAAGFLRWCSEQGATQLEDGSSMLLAQAAYQYARWHKLMPDVSRMHKSWRALVLGEQGEAPPV